MYDIYAYRHSFALSANAVYNMHTMKITCLCILFKYFPSLSPLLMAKCHLFLLVYLHIGWLGLNPVYAKIIRVLAICNFVSIIKVVMFLHFL
jgi:hypothetical protein